MTGTLQAESSSAKCVSQHSLFPSAIFWTATCKWLQPALQWGIQVSGRAILFLQFLALPTHGTFPPHAPSLGEFLLALQVSAQLRILLGSLCWPPASFRRTLYFPLTGYPRVPGRILFGSQFCGDRTVSNLLCYICNSWPLA